MTAARSECPESTSEKKRIKVWDPLVRVLHWSLATMFAAAYISADLLEGLHTLAGYAIVAIVGLRALWGLVGTRHARFDGFVPTLRELVAYLRDVITGRGKRYVGHNPAGGVMTILILVSLLATAGTGVLTLHFGKMFGDMHESFASLNLVMVLIHIAGVLLTSVLHGENLVAAMISGRKRT